MNKRGIQAVAVMAVVFVALTGARRSHGGGCSSHSDSSSSSSGFTSGGDSSSSSGVSGGVDVDLPSSTYSPPATYDPDATSEVSGSNCRYEESTKQLKYDLMISNNSSTDSFDYSLTTHWNEGQSTYDKGVLLGSDFQSVTIGPGQSETVTADSYYTPTKQTYYTCTVERATKFRS